jgi:superfamily II DNA or RNA helicase
MLIIKAGSTYFEFECEPNGNIDNGAFNIKRYIDRLVLTRYNYKLRCTMIEFRFLYYKNGICRMPINNLQHFLTTIGSAGIVYEIIENTPYQGEVIDIPRNTNWVDRPKQIPAIDFIVNNPRPMRALSLQTGLGKTYCAIKAICLLRRRGIIFVNGLLEQWVSAIKSQTLLKDEEIYLIQGQSSLKKLQRKLDSKKKPKIYVASISTIKLYVLANKHPYDKFIPFNKFFEHLGVGVKVTDECHLNFTANTIIDLNCNIAHNIYLSATYERSDTEGHRIFEIIFPPEIKHGENEYEKYVDIYGYKYNLGFIPEAKCVTPEGYNQSKYEMYLMKSKKINYLFDQYLTQLIDSHWINIKRHNQKLLILCNTREFCLEIKNRIEKYYADQNFNIGIYLYETDDSLLDESDIIISTVKSCGTGRDISNLRTVILLSSFNSSPLTKQSLGRLRKLPNGDTPEFIFMSNTGIRSHMIHFENRSLIYQELGKSFKVYEL